MSDATDEFGFEARQLLNKSKLNALREQMRMFVGEHDRGDRDLKALRRDVSRGKALSDIVDDDRDERL